ncbi:MAG: hypothetical protein ACEB74_01980 [Desulfovibrio aminophilus]|uniref:hypothetical protein n=1 Tax=Desulfovibrio aminophilus TaxID=81425 RepID=UPI0039E8C819
MKSSRQIKTAKGKAPQAPRLLPKRRLKTAQDLRVFLADVTNRANRGELDPGLARCLGYLGQVLAGIISTSDLEKRLEALEAQAKENRR